MSKSLSVYLWPHFDGPDRGDGGVRRVVDAQRQHLPASGIEVVGTVAEADLVAAHITAPREVLETSKPLVAHNHGFYWDEYDWSGDGAIKGWQYKANRDCMELVLRADAVTAPTEWVAQAIRRASLRPAISIGHGVDIDVWQRGEDGPHRKYVLWNKTRPDPVCDPKDVAMLASLLPRIGFVSTFMEGEPGSNVTVTGVLPYEEAQALVRHAGLYLCTARETFGIGTLEALAAGVPIVGWDWGGQSEFVTPRVGKLVTPGDFEALAEAIKEHLQPKVRGRKSAAARALVQERFQWSQVIPEYARLYEAVLAEHRAERPTVSVVVPAYKLAEHLPAALDSVKAQTMKDWECIVVDDASPDETGAVADSYADDDERFRVVHHSENQYLAGALNSGIALARGRYILPLDADNLITPGTLAALSDALDADRATDIAYGRVRFVEANGVTPSVYDGHEHDPGHSGWPMAFRADWQIEGKNLVPSTSMFRRRVWKHTGGYRRRWRTSEDADFWMRATSYGYRARMVVEIDTLIYRNRADSMSRTEARPAYELWYPWNWHDDVPAPAACAVHDGALLQIPSAEPIRISVVIPVGPGHGRYVLDAVDSVDSQSFRTWECIVVNDSGEPLPPLPSWVRVIEAPGAPVGVAAARNLGIAASRGKLFIPLDADDSLEPSAMDDYYGAWKRFGGYVYSDHNALIDGGLEVWETPEYDARILLRKGCLHAVTGLYPKSAWEEVGGFDTELPAWEDWDFELALAEIGECGTRIPKPLFVYRKETGARREENWAHRDEGKAAILAKWGPYIREEKTLMACSGCRGGGGNVVMPQAAQQVAKSQQAPPPPEEMSGWRIVEFIGAAQGLQSFRAPSGQVYQFGAGEGHNTKYVTKNDAEWLGNRTDFRIRSAEAPAPAA